MDNNQSPISLHEDDDIVWIVALNENQEEMTDNLPDLPNTQYVLEVEPAQPKRNKGKTLVNQKKKQVTWMKKHPMYVWLENSWQSDVTIPVMKSVKVNKSAVETKDIKLYHAGQTVTKIMKVFISHLKETKKVLTNCGFGNFEEGLRCRIIHDTWETPHDGLGRRFERAIIQMQRWSWNNCKRNKTKWTQRHLHLW